MQKEFTPMNDHASEATATEPVSVELLLIMTIMTIIGEVGENRG